MIVPLCVVVVRDNGLRTSMCAMVMIANVKDFDLGTCSEM